MLVISSVIRFVANGCETSLMPCFTCIPEMRVHLDIKPENIMYQRVKNLPELTEDILIREYPTMTFKLGDFGFCEIYDSDEAAVTTVDAGTRDYQSPELKQSQLREEGIRSKPCDIYSLGMTLASCLMPFEGFPISTQNRHNATTHSPDRVPVNIPTPTTILPEKWRMFSTICSRQTPPEG